MRWTPPADVSRTSDSLWSWRGRYAATAEALDLGSGKVKVLDLSTELVVLDWVYEPTLEHVTRS